MGEGGEKGEGPYLGQWHALWGLAVQHDHALKRHICSVMTCSVKRDVLPKRNLFVTIARDWGFQRI